MDLTLNENHVWILRIGNIFYETMPVITAMIGLSYITMKSQDMCCLDVDVELGYTV